MVSSCKNGKTAGARGPGPAEAGHYGPFWPVAEARIPNPGFGATTAILTVVNSLVLRPLPFPAADRLVVLFATSPKQGSIATQPRFSTSGRSDDRSDRGLPVRMTFALRRSVCTSDGA
jgi:hypothetical protein